MWRCNNPTESESHIFANNNNNLPCDRKVNPLGNRLFDGDLLEGFYWGPLGTAPIGEYEKQDGADEKDDL